MLWKKKQAQNCFNTCKEFHKDTFVMHVILYCGKGINVFYCVIDTFILCVYSVQCSLLLGGMRATFFDLLIHT